MVTDELTCARVGLRPLDVSHAEDLFQAVESSRDLLKRRLRWVKDVRSVRDEAGFIVAAGDIALWGVFEVKSGALLGIASLEGLAEKEKASARFAVWIKAEGQDHGYATESGRAVIEWAFGKLNLHRIFVRMDPANRPFRRVLKKLGFRYEGCLRDDKRLNGRWVDQECWGLLKAEWKK